MPDETDLWTCSECGLAPDLTWQTFKGADGLDYHVSFDGKGCGPIFGNPASPQEDSDQ